MIKLIIQQLSLYIDITQVEMKFEGHVHSRKVVFSLRLANKRLKTRYLVSSSSLVKFPKEAANPRELWDVCLVLEGVTINLQA